MALGDLVLVQLSRRYGCSVEHRRYVLQPVEHNQPGIHRVLRPAERAGGQLLPYLRARFSRTDGGTDLLADTMLLGRAIKTKRFKGPVGAIASPLQHGFPGCSREIGLTKA